MSSRLYRLYNTKAWTEVGYTYDGEGYCVAHVNLQWRTTDGDEPYPIFSSDEVPSDWVCRECHKKIG